MTGPYDKERGKFSMNTQQTKKPYTPPRVIALGKVREVVLGSAADDTADMNTARYW
jgi:hypothetical protein